MHPPSLQEDIELPVAVGDEDLSRERFDFTGHDALGRAARVFGSLLAGKGWCCVIRQMSGSPGRSSIYLHESATRSSAGVGDLGQIGTTPAPAEDGLQSPDEETEQVSAGRDRFTAPGYWWMFADLAGRVRALGDQHHPRLSRLFLILLILLALCAWPYGPSSAPTRPHRDEESTPTSTQARPGQV